MKIDKRIVGFEVVKEDATEETVEIVDTGEKMARPEVLHGTTYKLDAMPLSNALYLTINDFEDEQGRRRPFEMFVSTKTSKDIDWINALMLVASAVLRRPGNFEIVIDELEHVFDPKGGYWLPKGGGHCPSVVAHIGKTLRRHCEEIGAL